MNMARDTDPYELLGLRRAFHLDAQDVERAYLTRIASLHPDRETDPILQAERAREAALVNHARQALLDPEARANTLLALLGGPSKEDDNSLPDGFLMDILNVRQELEEARMSGDPAERARLEAWARDARAKHIESISARFQEVVTAINADRDDLLREIRLELNAWRYVERMIEQIDD